MDTRPRLQILYTPAGLVENHQAARERERLRVACAGGKALGREVLGELRCGAWLGGETWYRGGYLTTRGLRDQVGHPELALLNVPGAFAPMAQQLLNEIGEYVLDSGARLASGEGFALTHRRFDEMIVTFASLLPGELSSPEFGEEMLLVVPLP